MDLGHRPVVLDPAREMIRPAAERGITVVRGVSQAMPFRDKSFDLAWFHLSLHYGNWAEAVDESIRVTNDPCKSSSASDRFPFFSISRLNVQVGIGIRS